MTAMIATLKRHTQPACPSIEERASFRRDRASVWLGRMALVLGITLPACHSFPKAPTFPSDDAAFAPPTSIEPPGMTDDPPAPYVVRPGDIFRLRVASVDPMDVSDLTVDTTGILHVPLGGDVNVAGLTLAKAEKAVENAIHPMDRFARVTLSVQKPSGQRVTVSGVVSRPGVYEISPDARVAEVLALSGGPRTADAEGEQHDLADLDGARIYRGGAPLPISVSRATEGDPRHNVRVRPGDVLYVPPSRGRRVIILGEVASPKVVPFQRGFRLSEALAIAGGTTKDADNADIRVVRGPLSHPKVYVANLRALVNGSGGDIELAPGDIVFVTEHWFATTTNVISRLTPLLAATAVTATMLRVANPGR